MNVIIHLDDCDERIIEVFTKARGIQEKLAPIISTGEGTTSAERIDEVAFALLMFTRNMDTDVKEALYEELQMYMDVLLKWRE